MIQTAKVIASPESEEKKSPGLASGAGA